MPQFEIIIIAWSSDDASIIQKINKKSMQKCGRQSGSRPLHSYTNEKTETQEIFWVRGPHKKIFISPYIK